MEAKLKVPIRSMAFLRVKIFVYSFAIIPNRIQPKYKFDFNLRNVIREQSRFFDLLDLLKMKGQHLFNKMHILVLFIIVWN